MALKYLNLTGLTNLVTDIMNWVTSRIPTKTSEIDNDSGYLTASDLPTNHVTKNTTQTISGAKTFSNNLYFNANTHRIIYMNNTAWTMGEAIPSSTKYIGSLVHRCNGTDCSYIDTRRDTTGNVYQQHGVKWKFTNGVTATDGTAIESIFAHGLTANGTRYVYWNGYLHDINVVPITNNNNSLGDSTHRWTNVYGTVRLDPAAGATADLLYSQMAVNGYFRLQVGGTSNNGYVEIATADNGNEPIYVRQYKGVFATLQRTLTLLDGSGNTTLPGTLNAVSYKLNGTAFGDIVTHNASEFLTSHQSLSNYVTLNGAQTITAIKTISAAQPNMVFSMSGLTKTTDPSSQTYGNIYFQDKTTGKSDTKRAGSLDCGVSTSGQTEISMRAFNWGANDYTNAGIGVCYPKNGTPYTYAPTPATSDNSTQIATTAYVKAQGYLTEHPSITTSTDTTSTGTPAHGGTFTCIDSVTRDSNGHVTTVNTKTVTLPADSNTDTKVTQAYSTTNNSYPVLSSATAGITSTNSRGATTAIVNNGIYTNPSTGALYATKLYSNGTEVLTAHQSLSNYSTLANTVKSISISGKTITVTPGSGSAYTLTTQDTVYTHPTTAGNKHIPSGGSSGQFLGWDSDGTAKWVNNPNTNTDTLVTQNVSTANENHPILLSVTKDATTNQGAKTSIFASGVKVNPSTNTVTATTFSGALSGNASSATQFSANKDVTLTGDVTGTASSKAGWSVATTLANSGVTAGTYGPSADVTGNNNSTISVPQITVDAKGRVTSVTNRTLTCKNNTYNVYNKTLTIQKNGTNVATFTSNSNTNVTANIVVPTKTSDLTNDSNFVTSNDVSSAINYVVIAEVNPGYFTVTQNRLDNVHVTSSFAISPTLCLPSVGVSTAYDIDTTNWDVSGGDIHVVVQDANSKTVPGYVMIYLSKCAATDFVIIQLTSMARSAGIYVPTIKSGSNYYVKACFPTSGDFYVNIVKTAGTIGYAKLYPFLGNFGFVAPS